MYKLINPQGNEKCFKSVYELDNFIGGFIHTKNFKLWSVRNSLPGSFNHNGKEVVNTLVIKNSCPKKVIESFGHKIKTFIFESVIHDMEIEYPLLFTINNPLYF